MKNSLLYVSLPTFAAFIATIVTIGGVPDNFLLFMLLALSCAFIYMLWLAFFSAYLSCVRVFCWKKLGFREDKFLLWPFIKSEGKWYLLSACFSFYSVFYEGIPRDYLVKYGIGEDRGKLAAEKKTEVIAAVIVYCFWIIPAVVIHPSWLLVTGVYFLNLLFTLNAEHPQYKGLRVQWKDCCTGAKCFYTAKEASCYGLLDDASISRLLTQYSEADKRLHYYLYQSLQNQCIAEVWRSGLSDDSFRQILDTLKFERMTTDKSIITDGEKMNLLRILADSAVIHENTSQKEQLLPIFIRIDSEISAGIGCGLGEIWISLLRDRPVKCEMDSMLSDDKRLLSDIDFYRRKFHPVFSAAWNEFYRKLIDAAGRENNNPIVLCERTK